ncbi:hypothetical protein JCM21738_3019 [Mesobacillus boroniphilus JCM 21738]|uniref:Uncharacterized protein n=1 Tax=Mesobacillus boroniphilus JCM 21738 TaxID=1294265 RepID=W4RPA3_9BACI|nr:hypothetical protein JCM21738_3019 [Mesobacillus boroniphilus JCM 21738]
MLIPFILNIHYISLLSEIKLIKINYNSYVLTVILTATLASIGTAGVPGIGLIMLSKNRPTPL